MIDWKCRHCGAKLFGQSAAMAEHLKTCSEYQRKRLDVPREHHTVIPTKFKIGDRVCNHNTRTCVKGVVVGFEVRYTVQEDGCDVPHLARRAEYLKLEPVDPLVEAKAKIAALEARVSELESRNAGWAEGI